MNDSISDTAERTAYTPPTVSSMVPPHVDGRKNEFDVWNHFTKQPNSDKMAKCNYCGALIRHSGTSTMRAHLDRCKANPNKKQKTTYSATASIDANVTSPSLARFDQDNCRKELARLFVTAELPFRLVEHEGFRRYSNALQPRFRLPSRITLMRDILKLRDAEKTNLKKFLSQQCRRVCLTTDTWTSCQNMSYMCLTAHYIDNDRRLHKKILNFRQVKGHSGEVMAKFVESCLNEWGLNHVFSLTVDNATSNDAGIQQLKKRLVSRDCLVLGGEYMHMRCCAHILNLIVKEGLKEGDDSILRIRDAVRYISYSPKRYLKFEECAQQQKIEYKGHIFLDCESRWNSTYLMLSAALKYKKAFEELEWVDGKKYSKELEKLRGVPKEADWDKVDVMLPFLSIFYHATLRMSSTSNVTCNKYMLEVIAIWIGIHNLLVSSNEGSNAYLMAKRMMGKFNKYWGDPERLNMLLLIAVLLDPRYKRAYLGFHMNEIFGEWKATQLMSKLDSCLKSLFNEYNEGAQSDSQPEQVNAPDIQNDPYGLNRFRQSTGHNSKSKSEIEKYLKEELHTTLDLDILNWWKVNSCRFPVLSNIARELLAVPVSTVASESTFSTGGRVLDPYRSSLRPSTVEALICTQDWLKGTSPSFLSTIDLEEFKQLEKEMMDSQQDQDVASSTVFSLGD